MRFTVLAFVAACAVAEPNLDPSGVWEIEPGPDYLCTPPSPWTLRIRHLAEPHRYAVFLDMPSDPFGEPVTERRVTCAPEACQVHAKMYFDIDVTLREDGYLSGTAESEVCGEPLALHGRRTGE